MNKLKLLFIFFGLTSLFFSCSGNDDNKNSENIDTDGIVDVDPTENLITIDGEEFVYTQIALVRSEDSFALRIDNSAGQTIWFSFHKSGNYGELIYSPLTGDESVFDYLFNTLDVYPDRYFSFDFINLNEENKTVSLSFEGTIYQDGTIYEDFAVESSSELSDQIEVSGLLNLPYTTVDPVIEGLQISANFNDKEWQSTDGYTSGSGAGFTDVTKINYNNTKYLLQLNLNANNIQSGTYNFSEFDLGYNRIYLSEYSDLDGEDNYFEYLDYLCEGTLIINSFEFGHFEATFSFKATNPETNEIINVTSGIYKDIFLDL